MLTTSRCWPLLPASWGPTRGQTNYVLLWVRWANGKQLAIALQKSSVTLFTSEGSEDCDRLPSKSCGVPPQSRDSGHPPEASTLSCALSSSMASALQPLDPSHLIITSNPDSRPLSATLQSSYHHVLRVLLVRSDDPNAPPLIFGGMLEEGAYPLARRFLQGRMIEEIVRSQAPNKVLMTTPPPIDPAEQLLPRSYRSALSYLRSCYCSKLQSYHHSVGWADDPTCPDCHSTHHSVAHLFS